MLRRLIYLSTASQAMDAAELDGILEISRNNNQSRGITGLLVVKGDMFIQVLEGEEETLKTLFQVIQQDPRHREITIVSWDDAEARVFPNWSMGLKRLDEHEVHSDKMLNFDKISIQELTGNPSQVQELLQALLELD